MEKNHITIRKSQNPREYIKLDGKSNVKITPTMYGKKTLFKIDELMYIDTLPITISYYANKLGKAITDIENSYFDFKDPKEVFNAMGRIGFEISLLGRIKDDLERRKLENDSKITR